MQTSQDAFLWIKQKLSSYAQQGTSFFWSSAELPEILGNNDGITLFPKEIFDQSRALLEIVEATINEFEEKENAFSSLLNCLVTMLLRQAQRIHGDKNKQQEKNRLVAVIVLLVIFVNDSHDYSNSVGLGNVNKKVTLFLYNNVELYEDIIKSGCQCLKSILLSDDNEEEEKEKESKSLLCISSVMLIHILQKIHMCKDDLKNMKPLRKKCVIFLIMCGYAPSFLREAAVALLSAPSRSCWNVTEKCDFYTTVSHLLLLVLQKYQQCPFIIFNEFNISFIPWVAKQLQNVFFTHFLPFISSIACYLPTDQRFSVFSHLILSSKSKTNALIIKNKNIFQGAACMLCLASYYNNLVMVDYISKESQWDNSVELLGLIVSKRWDEFDTRTVTNQLKAFFLSLHHIIDTMDSNCNYEEQVDVSLIVSRYQKVEKILENLRTSKETFYFEILCEIDESIQEIHMNGWCWLLIKGVEKAKVSLRTGFLFHSWIAHTFLFLIEQNYKLTWKYVFTLIKTLFKSITELSLIVYNGLKAASRLYFLESFLRVTERLVEDKQNSQLHQLTLLTSQKLILSFSRWHQEFRRALFDTTFCHIVTHVMYAFRGCEEFRSKGINPDCGEQDLMSFLDISNPLSSPKMSSYIKPLQNCIASCFEAFGVSSILNKSCLSLQKLYQVPMSSSHFSLESNAWIVVEMSHSVCRDTLVTFSELIYPIIIQLKKKQQNSFDPKLAKLEASHYQCLIDQLWSLLPRFVNEALDFLDVMADPQNFFLNIILDNLKEPTTQKYICEALIIMSKQIHDVLSPYKSKSNFVINSIGGSKNKFMQQLWNIDTETCKELHIFRTQIDLIMSKLVLYYLQNDETSGIEITDIKEKKNLLYNTMESLSNLCTKELLEKNLHNFSRTWSSMVNQSIGVIRGEVRNNDKNAISLTSTQCAALVDVCAALVHCLPDHCLYQLFHSFSKIVLDCSEGIQSIETLPKSQVETKDVSFIASASTSDYKKSLSTLQYLLKSSYRGLDKAITCLTNSSQHEVFLQNLQPDIFMQLWKAVVECDAYVLKIISWKLRSALFTSLLRLFCSLKNTWDASLPSEATRLLLNSTIVGIVPQMLLSMSNINKHVREKGFNVLHLIIQNLCTPDAFMVHLLPGFASKDPTMRAATASAFVVFLRLWGTSIVNENLQKLFKIAMLLVYDKNKCVFRATLKLFRCILRFLPKPVLINKFNEMMTALLASPYASANRLSIRFIIEKSISYVSFEELEKVFPTSSLSLLQYVNREMKKRYEKKCRTSACVSSNKPYLQNKKEEQDTTDSDASSALCYTSNDPIDLFEKKQLMPFTALANNSKYENKFMVGKTSKKRGFENNMSSRSHKIQVIHNDRQEKGNKISTLKKINTDAKRVDNDNIRIDDNGKIVIENVSNNLEDNIFSHKPQNGLSVKSKKNFLNHQKDQPKQRQTGTSKNRSRIKKSHLVVKSSKNFSSKKGLGDVTRGVGVAPYSYIRLNPKVAKEKHRSSVIKAFKSELQLKKKRTGDTNIMCYLEFINNVNEEYLFEYHKEVLNIVPTPFDKNSIGYVSKRLHKTLNQSEINADSFEYENKLGTILNDSPESTRNQYVSRSENFSLSRNELKQQQPELNSRPDTPLQQSGLLESESIKDKNIIQVSPSKEEEKLLNEIRTVPSPWKDDVPDMTDMNPENNVFFFDDEWDKVFQLLLSGYEPPQNLWLKFRKHIDI